MKTVKWVDVQSEPNQVKNEDDDKQVKTMNDTAAVARPAKRKVVDTEQEPSYNLIPGTAAEIELLFSAVSDYAKYELNTNKVFFKDTLMFQTRMYRYEKTVLVIYSRNIVWSYVILRYLKSSDVIRDVLD